MRWQLARDQHRLTALIGQLGWFGSIALVALNAFQIIIAPIPGYVVQLVTAILLGLGSLLALFLRDQERLIVWFDQQTFLVIRQGKLKEHL